MFIAMSVLHGKYEVKKNKKRVRDDRKGKKERKEKNCENNKGRESVFIMLYLLIDKWNQREKDSGDKKRNR